MIDSIVCKSQRDLELPLTGSKVTGKDTAIFYKNPLSLLQQRNSTRLGSTSPSADVALRFSLESFDATTFLRTFRAELLLIKLLQSLRNGLVIVFHLPLVLRIHICGMK